MAHSLRTPLASTPRQPQLERTGRRGTQWLRQVWLGAWRALKDFYSAPFRVDPTLANTTPEALEQQRRSRLFTLLAVTLFVLQCFSLMGQAATGAPIIVMASQTGVLVLSVVCLLINWWGYTAVASLIYLLFSGAGVLVGLTQLGGALDLRGLMMLTLFTIFVVLSGLLLPRWAIWLIAALAIAGGVVELLIVPLPTNMGPTAISLGAEAIRPVVVGIYVMVIATLALLTWAFSRTSFAGLESVTQALTRERELTALKDLFIMDANHELRTPIMALYNNLELLDLLRTHDATPERQQQALARALKAGDAVIHLLNTILDPTVLEGKAPPLRIETIALAPLVRTVLETFDPREVGELSLSASPAAPRTVNLSIPETYTVLADSARVRQVLINLIVNALKYSQAGTPIEIAAHTVPEKAPVASTIARRGSFGPAKRDGGATSAAIEPAHDLVEVRIRDFGLGIPTGEQVKLFNRFVRLERDITGSVRGTGIGLYVCRTLIEAMGGTIWVESSGVEGEGSTFCFTLPCVPHVEPTDALDNTSGDAPVAEQVRSGHASIGFENADK